MSYDNWISTELVEPIPTDWSRWEHEAEELEMPWLEELADEESPLSPEELHRW